MSGKLETKHDAQRSHLSSFTMKLKHKFHSPKLKRSPSKSVRQTPEEYTRSVVPKSENKRQSQLEVQEKEVVSALRYFKIIVDKMAVDSRLLGMLPGSASKVLEAVLQLFQTEPTMQQRPAVSCLLGPVYQSLADLIHWSDQVLLNGANQDDKDSTVTTVIKAVLDGVKELVKMTMETEEDASQTPPVRLASPSPSQASAPAPSQASAPAPSQTSAPAPSQASAPTPSQASALGGEEMRNRMEAWTLAHVQPAEPQPRPQPQPLPSLSRGDAPPKPPISSGNATENSPPVLPPKRRSSVPRLLPSSTLLPSSRIAVVAPMRRTTLPPPNSILNIQECEEKCVSDCREETVEWRAEGVLDQAFPRGSWWWDRGAGDSQERLNRLSGPSLTGSEDTNSDQYDPDYDFLLEDLSNQDTLPPLGGSLSPVAEATNHEPSSSSCPPALPEKKRRSHAPQSPVSQSPAPSERCLSVYDNVSCEDDCPTPPFPLFLPMFRSMDQDDLPPNSPPPLPEKKTRHILQYMQFVEDYCEPQPSMFYHSNQSKSSYHLRNQRFQEACQLTDTLPAPSLPPKQRQQDDSSAPEDCQEMPSSESLQTDTSDPDLTEDCSLSNQEKESLSLVDHSQIKSLLTLKQEDDDGPDVRAGPGDILLVHATETDQQDIVMYYEAFLTTYRTFITPEDLVKKLHYRYSRFCHSTDASRKVASRNSFCVLARVVDELCGVELSEELLRFLLELVFRLLIGGELNRARLLRSNILNKVEKRRRLNSTLCLCPLAARGVAARPGTLHDFRSHEIAEQLTLLDAKLFYKIEIPEVLLWAKEQNEERSPNLTLFTEHFNNMSYWVRSLIMLQEKAQEREKLLLKFIKVMKHLRKLNNFNSYLAILSALDSAPLRRLEWQKQTSESLEEYSSLIDSSSSFRAYRTALAEVQPEHPCIPYLGLILQDLTFVHLGNPDLVEGKVNFSKRWQQFHILDSMRCFQQNHYSLRQNEDIVSFFNDFNDHLAEEALWELSQKIKPRNATRRTEPQERT
ncbi:rap guanine nucleotide exchange factor 1 [Hypomesus transpacificus]|uniref:rap guanine nucleotide exchange factor 1 n=1 Tax=Hypomesus transpacificus TaxID=137520 RepID=UPI001F075D75|nr:rap guanine nucleotide exchange factor 1 [Hypomesus transpacificus]